MQVQNGHRKGQGSLLAEHYRYLGWNHSYRGRKKGHDGLDGEGDVHNLFVL